GARLLQLAQGPRTAYPREASVHALMAAQAARSPQATAAIHGARRLTHGRLQAQASRLAARLLARGVRPGECVAIALPRSLELLVAQLAILQCAGVYVPLDV